MISEKVMINNPSGLHLRPAGLLCKTAIEFKCKITFIYAGGIANAKSVLSVLGACIKCGDEVEFEFDGEDEVEAKDRIITIVKEGLGEL